MIKRTVGLRPIKYSKLPSKPTIGMFNESVFERQSLKEAFDKFNMQPIYMNEKDIFAQWHSNEDLNELDFVLLFSHIPHNELKDIWAITGCDQIIKFPSFNRIYNQCVYSQDFLWINCADVDTIEQKIRWDKISFSTSSKLKKATKENIVEKESLKIKTPPNLPQEFTTVSIPTVSEKASHENIETTQTTQGETPSIRKVASQNNLVSVIDIVNNEEQTWTVSLPKKVVVLEEAIEQKSSDGEDGSCNIL